MQNAKSFAGTLIVYPNKATENIIFNIKYKENYP